MTEQTWNLSEEPKACGAKIFRIEVTAAASRDTVTYTVSHRGHQKRDRERFRLIAAAPDLLAALEAIAKALDVPRNRFGKLEVRALVGEPLRELAVAYQVGPCADTPEQAMKVARAAIAKARGQT